MLFRKFVSRNSHLHICKYFGKSGAFNSVEEKFFTDAYVKPGLHLKANTNDACASEARQNIRYICTLFGIHRGIE